MKPLTRNQCNLINYLWVFFHENDQLPPCEMIKKHFGWSSANSAVEKLESLRGRGLLERNSCGKWKFAMLARQSLAVGPWQPPPPQTELIERALKQVRPAPAASAHNPFSLRGAIDDRA